MIHMDLTNMDTTLQAILANAPVPNEAGEEVTTFEYEGRDCYDFLSLSKSHLLTLMREAYEAGMNAA